MTEQTNVRLAAVEAFFRRSNRLECDDGLGHLDEAARIMARGRVPVRESGSLVDAARGLGLTQSGARAFARGRGLTEAAVVRHEDPAGDWKGGDFPASDYGYVGDGADSETWALLLTKVPGGDVDPDAVRSAVMAIDPLNPAENPVPEDAMSDVVAKLAKSWKAAGLGELPAVLADEALMAAFRQLGHTSGAGLRAAARGRERRR
jgi:hypothetical protein